MNFEDFAILSPDLPAQAQAKEILRAQARPIGSLGQLDELAIKMAGILGIKNGQPINIIAVLMCGDHGVSQEGVSIFPQEVTLNISRACLKNLAAFNIFAKHVDAKIEIVDCGIIGNLQPSPLLISKKIQEGTKNIANCPAMSLSEAYESIAIGVERSILAAANGFKIIAIGEIGNSNTTVASALLSALTGISPFDVVGKGTGFSDSLTIHKANVITKALDINKPRLGDPIDCLRCVGGFEIGAMAGAILGAASRKICVSVDGFISSVSALLAARINPRVLDYIFFSHLSQERGHSRVLDILNAKPLFDLNMKLGEATGALLGASILRLSYSVLTDIGSFSTVRTPDPYVILGQ